MTSSTFNDDSAESGGAVYGTNSLTVTGSRFEASAATGGPHGAFGGAIAYIDYSTSPIPPATITNSTIIGNTASVNNTAGLVASGGGSGTWHRT